MKFGAEIPLREMPYFHNPGSFPRMEKWQTVAALEAVYKFVKEGKVLGPFPGDTRLCPVTGKPLCFYPSFVVPKSTPGSYRWILNASYNRGGPSINDRISDYTTKLISVRESLKPCLRTRFMSRIDLRRAFKQLFRKISQLNLLATKIGDQVFIDATMSMGLRNTCKLFEEDFMKAFVRGLVHHHPQLFSDDIGWLVDNYLDDIWFLADTQRKNEIQLLVAEYWANWLGIELNNNKRELPRSVTRHLGFQIDLEHKMVSITLKHKNRILAFFNRFIVCIRSNGRIPIRDIQRMLGLQIWISTVFRVTRQFLTSTCEVLRGDLGKKRFFFPRHNRVLASRILFDLKFWRRFVKGSPTSSFKYLLGQLPPNEGSLYSDASSLFGMGGVFLFGNAHHKPRGSDGLFWQVTWSE